MVSQFLSEGSRAVQYVIAFVIILALVLLFAWVLRRLTGGRLLLPGQDRTRSRQPRLGVVDIYDLDRQRQLVLLRRDNVEHLLLIGGPNDVVVETNIIRVPGARLPSGSTEQPVPEAGAEPSLRSPFEPAVRPSIEQQISASLSGLTRRGPDEPEIDQELAPVASLSATIPPRPLKTQPEPVLRPTRTEPTVSPPFPDRLAGMSEPFRAEPNRPSPPQTRPAPTIQPELAPATEEGRTSDAAVLSNMAKQLEEALKRPAQPAAPIPPFPSPAAQQPPQPSPSPISSTLDEAPQARVPRPAAKTGLIETENETRADEPRLPPVPATEPVRPAPAPTPPTSPTPAKSENDPFSVEEIEAEFARLLGRPGDKG